MFYTPIEPLEILALEENGWKRFTPDALLKYGEERFTFEQFTCRFCQKTSTTKFIQTHYRDWGVLGLETMEIHCCPECGIVARSMHEQFASGYWKIGQKKQVNTKGRLYRAAERCYKYALSMI